MTPDELTSPTTKAHWATFPTYTYSGDPQFVAHLMQFPKVRVERRGAGLLVARLMLYKHWVPLSIGSPCP
jgi:hypothetical protein